MINYCTKEIIEVCIIYVDEGNIECIPDKEVHH